MALGLAMRGMAAAVIAHLVCSACSASSPTLSTASENRGKPPKIELGTDTAARAAPWPAKTQLFLLKSARATLELRSAGSHFAHPLASNAQIIVHDPILELAWLSDGQTLSVIDLRDPAPHTVAPIIIATGLPPHVEVHVARAEHRVGPTDACDVAPILVLHWTSEPWIESDGGERLTHLGGSAWLAREIDRPLGRSGVERWFHPSDPHVALPADRARCEDARWCGASQALGAGGLRLVLTDQSEGADCWHFGCLLFNGENGTFATPPQGTQWSSARDTPSGSCGPYRFDAAGSAVLVDGLFCAVGGSCVPLGGFAIGWLTPGVTLGAPG